MATGFLMLVVMLAEYMREGCKVRDVLESVPDDLTGWDELQKVVQPLIAKLQGVREAASYPLSLEGCRRYRRFMLKSFDSRIRAFQRLHFA